MYLSLHSSLTLLQFYKGKLQFTWNSCVNSGCKFGQRGRAGENECMSGWVSNLWHRIFSRHRTNSNKQQKGCAVIHKYMNEKIDLKHRLSVCWYNQTHYEWKNHSHLPTSRHFIHLLSFNSSRSHALFLYLFHLTLRLISVHLFVWNLNLEWGFSRVLKLFRSREEEEEEV